MSTSHRRLEATLRHLNNNNNNKDIDASSSSQFVEQQHCAMEAGSSSSNFSGVAPEVPLSSEFFYTLDDTILTREQRQFYEENGYIIIRKLIPVEDLQLYARQFAKLCNGEVPMPHGIVVMRDVKISDMKGAKGEKMITKIQDYQGDPVLFEYCKHPAILRYVKGFVGHDAKAIHSMLIAKPPGFEESGRHPLHQDLSYFPFRPANRIVCSWTAMETVNRANGCLVALPGTHKGELRMHEYPEFTVNKYYYGVKGMEKEEIDSRVHLEMEAGDTVFFHPILIHGSGGNKTDHYRRAISCHYASCDCQYLDHDLKGTPHELMESEAKEAVRKRYGIDNFDYRIFWRNKSRLVAGREGTL